MLCLRGILTAVTVGTVHRKPIPSTRTARFSVPSVLFYSAVFVISVIFGKKFRKTLVIFGRLLYNKP